METVAITRPAPEKTLEERPDMPMIVGTTGVFVVEDGLMHITEFNAGLYLIDMDGEQNKELGNA